MFKAMTKREPKECFQRAAGGARRQRGVGFLWLPSRSGESVCFRSARRHSVIGAGLGRAYEWHFLCNVSGTADFCSSHFVETGIFLFL